MITETGYSKNTSLIPSGIAITFTKEFIDRNYRGGIDGFCKKFENCMKRDDFIFSWKLQNLPKHDIAWVYIIIECKLIYRCNFIGTFAAFTDRFNGGREKVFAKWVDISGPALKAPNERTLRGFRNFRYTTQLF